MKGSEREQERHIRRPRSKAKFPPSEKGVKVGMRSKTDARKVGESHQGGNLTRHLQKRWKKESVKGNLGCKSKAEGGKVL